VITDKLDSDSYAARHGVTCRICGAQWPCPGWTEDWLNGGHRPVLIPNGALVTTADDLDRLVSWSPGANTPVVIDRDAVAWLLFCTEDGDSYAGTIPCPDRGIPERLELDDLPERGPLRVVFNGDPKWTNESEKKGNQR
jgi:hypothetical protein